MDNGPAVAPLVFEVMDDVDAIEDEKEMKSMEEGTETKPSRLTVMRSCQRQCRGDRTEEKGYLRENRATGDGSMRRLFITGSRTMSIIGPLKGITKAC